MTDHLPLHLLTPRSCRMARAGLGLLQADIARAAGIHRRTVKQLETGMARPMAKTATGIMTAFLDRGVVFGFDGSVRIDLEDAEPTAPPAYVRPPQLKPLGAQEAR